MKSEAIKDADALYALGALDPMTARRFEQYLRTGAEADRQSVLGMIETAALLPLELPVIDVPPHLKRRLLDRVSEEKKATVIPFTRPAQPISPARLWLPVAASVMLAFCTVILLWQNRQLSSSQAQIAAQLQTSTGQLAAARQQWEGMISPATRVISLRGDAAPQASAKLIWDTQRQQWVIYLSNLPALPADKDYQLWYLTSDQSKISAAIFRPDAQGRGELKISVPPSIIPRLAATAVSLEPKGGSSQPTGPIFLKGAI